MVRRALRWILPLVVLIDVVLVWSGALDLRDAVLVGAGLEALLFLIGLGGLVFVVRRYRKEQKAGLDPWKALEAGLSLMLPPTAAHFILNEPRLFACLLRWTFRRVRFAEDEFSYHKRSSLRALMPLLVVSAPVELVVVHVLALAFSPWGWLKWALLVLGIYAILWLLGLYASLVVLPYRLEETGLRLRHGILAEGFIPYEDIDEVIRTARKASIFGNGSPAPEENALYLDTEGKSDLALRLKTPHSVMGFLKESDPACLLHLTADDPEQFVRQLRRRIGNQTPSSVRS